MALMDDFHFLVGETLMYCQCIENDIKLMCSALIDGDFNTNMQEVEMQGMGYALTVLKEADQKRKNPYFDKSDYNLLHSLRKTRNYYAHQVYVNFVYLQGESFERGLVEEYSKLEGEHLNLSKLVRVVEKVRLQILKDSKKFK